MSELVRTSFSIESSLYERLESLVKESGYTNRSEYLRDMIRQQIVERQWQQNAEVIGTLTLVYDHEVRLLSEKLTDLQHDHHDVILATTHVHLDRHMCAEMTLMKGRAGRLRRIADLLRQQKGVLHATLSLGSTGADLE